MIPRPAAVEALAEHARQRSENARQAVDQAISDLRRRREPINVNAVARRAGVTRRTIYNHTDLLDRIRSHSQRLRDPDSLPSDENASVIATLQDQLETQKSHYEAAITELKAQLRDREQALAAARSELQSIRTQNP